MHRPRKENRVIKLVIVAYSVLRRDAYLLKDTLKLMMKIVGGIQLFSVSFKLGFFFRGFLVSNRNDADPDESYVLAVLRYLCRIACTTFEAARERDPSKRLQKRRFSGALISYDNQLR